MQACPCPWLLSAPNRHVLFSLSDSGQRQILAFPLDTRLLWALDLNRPFCLGHQGTSLWSRPFPTTSTQPPGSQAAAASQKTSLSSFLCSCLLSFTATSGSVYSKVPLLHKPSVLLCSTAGQGKSGVLGLQDVDSSPSCTSPQSRGLGQVTAMP